MKHTICQLRAALETKRRSAIVHWQGTTPAGGGSGTKMVPPMLGAAAGRPAAPH